MKKFRLLTTALALLLTVGFASAQTTVKVKGTVTEAGNGEPIPSVAVSQKGSTTNRTISDDLGNYTISVPKDAVIVFQALGFQTLEIPLNGRTELNVALEVDAIVLEGAVSIGYGSSKKVGNIVGTVTTVKSDVVKNAPVASALDLLQGQVAGMQVLSTGGVAGDNNISMRIHGVGSLTSSAEPLFIVDGIQSSSSAVMAMNPNDILNITILTDASATSIYGSQGANGVVYVTTKSGAFNKDATVTFTSQYGISTLANEQFYKNFMSGDELKDFWLRSGLMSAEGIKATYTDKGYDANTEWYKYIQRLNNPQYQNDISIEGGSDRTAYLITASQFHQDGNTIGNFYDRYTVRSNIQARPKEWLKTGINLNASISQDMANEAWGNSSEASSYVEGGLSYMLNPLYPAVDENGVEYSPKYPNGIYNQYYYTQNYVNKYSVYRIIASAYAEIEPVKNLVFTSRVGTDAYAQFMDRYLMPSSLMAEGSGMVQKTTYYAAKSTVNNTLEYNLTFNDNKDDISLLVGQEYIDYNYHSFASFGSGIKDDRLLSLDNTLVDTRKVRQSKTQYRFLSFFGHAEFSHADKYFADFTIRNDASSRFGKNTRNGTFWAAGLMWKITNEEGFKSDYPWLTKLHLKASYGTQGNANIGNYAHLGLIASLATPYNGNFGVVLNSPSNEDITWEKQGLFTVSLESRDFDKLDLDMAVYQRNTSDMLMSVPQPYTTGFSSVYANVGALTNSGIDLTLNYDLINTRDAYLGLRATFTYNREKVTKLFNGLDRWEIDNTLVAFVVGKPVTYYCPIFAGIDPESGKPTWYLPAEKVETVTNPETGALEEQVTVLRDECTMDPSRVTDKFDDYALTQNTGKLRHEPISGGFGISGRYHSWQIRADFTYVLGKYLVNNDRYFYANPSNFPDKNTHKMVSDFWTPYNTDAQFPDWSKGYTMQFDTALLEDASFLRLKTLVIGYSLPQRLLMKQRVFKSAMITLTGRNLITLSKYTGIDPEVDSNLTYGIPGNTLQVLAGLELKF